MRIKKLFGVKGARQAEGITVIIDIFRAATVSAFLLAKGVKQIIPVSTKEEAFELKQKDPAIILVGEINGYKIPGFDYGNSPFEISKVDNIEGKTVVHRTSQGTQGLIHAVNATDVIFGSFVTASAILKYIEFNITKIVTIVAMDGQGTEDDIFADLLISKVKKQKSQSLEEIVKYLQKHPGAARFLDPKLPEFPKEDFDLCLDLDRFNFVPIIQDGRIIKREI